MFAGTYFARDTSYSHHYTDHKALQRRRTQGYQPLSRNSVVNLLSMRGLNRGLNTSNNINSNTGIPFPPVNPASQPSSTSSWPQPPPAHSHTQSSGLYKSIDPFLSHVPPPRASTSTNWLHNIYPGAAPPPSSSTSASAVMNSSLSGSSTSSFSGGILPSSSTGVSSTTPGGDMGGGLPGSAPHSLFKPVQPKYPLGLPTGTVAAFGLPASLAHPLIQSMGAQPSTSARTAGVSNNQSWQNPPAVHSSSITVPDTTDNTYAPEKHIMFLAKVLVGKYTQGDSSFRRPPPINNNDQHRLYDSCVDNAHKPSIYVIFDTLQCYPQYIIEYNIISYDNAFQ